MDSDLRSLTRFLSTFEGAQALIPEIWLVTCQGTPGLMPETPEATYRFPEATYYFLTENQAVQAGLKLTKDLIEQTIKYFRGKRGMTPYLLKQACAWEDFQAKLGTSQVSTVELLSKLTKELSDQIEGEAPSLSLLRFYFPVIKKIRFKRLDEVKFPYVLLR